MAYKVRIKLGGFELFSLVRLGGPGFGNILLTIAHGIKTAQEKNCELIYPVIPQFKFGPYYRRERDKRTYFGEIKHRPFLTAYQIVKSILFSDQLVKVEGLYDYFRSLEEHKSFIRRWLFSNLSDPKPVNPKIYDIAIHVRRGDFSNGPTINGQNQQLSDDWCIRALELAINESVCEKCDILVSSDDNGEIFEVIKKHLGSRANVSRNIQSKAFASIQKLSNTRTMIISRSTFSLWAVFLSETNKMIIADTGFDYNAYIDTRKYVFKYVE